MNIKMWNNGFTYNIQFRGVFYYWCDNGGNRWRKRVYQEGAEFERKIELDGGRVEWVKLKSTDGLPE